MSDMTRLLIEPEGIDGLIQRVFDGTGYHDATQIPVDDVRKMMRALVAYEHNWNQNLVQMYADHLKWCTSFPPINVDSFTLPPK